MSQTRIEKYRHCATCGHKSRQLAAGAALDAGTTLLWLGAAIVFPIGLFILLAWPELVPRRQWTCTECTPEEY